MNQPTPYEHPTDSRPALVAASIIALVTAVAFSNSLAGPFVLDDRTSILDNTSIRQLWPISGPLSPPTHGETVMGRPVLNLSLAVNYAVSGPKVWSYHAVNLAIHIAGALLLFGLLRRTFLLPTMKEQWGIAATPLSLIIAMLWAVHPLQTESVTYIVQRAESLAGLFFLLTLYAVLRGATSARMWGWYGLAIAACLFGMGTKEVMVGAPLVALLYDRTFLAGSFREALRRRPGLYAGLTATWGLLAVLIIGSGGRGGTAGFGDGVRCGAYLCTQFGAIVHYLRLTVWPSPMVFDYGNELAQSAAEIVPYAIVVGLLGVATLVGLWRWPKVGFLGGCFFVLLAPTSSIVPVVTQTMAEHRMYMALAAVITAVVLGAYAVLHACADRGWLSRPAVGVLFGCAAAAVTLMLGGLTFQRNNDYRSELSIWQDTVAKAPTNVRALNDLGNALIGCGHADQAISHFKRALEAKPDDAELHNNLGRALARCGRTDQAMACFRKAIELQPDLVGAYNNLGNAEAACGHWDRAIAQYKKALDAQPHYAEAHMNLGMVLARRGQLDEALMHLRKALEFKPDDAEAHSNLGVLLASCKQQDEAMAHFQKALEIRPDYADAHNNLATALIARGRVGEAVSHFRIALEARPNNIQAQLNLGRALLLSGCPLEASLHFKRALQIDPGNLIAVNQLAWLLATCADRSQRNGAEAIRLAQEADQRTGGKVPDVLRTLAAAYAEAGRFPDAVAAARKGLDLATKQNRRPLMGALRAELALYEAGKPYRQTLSPPATPEGSRPPRKP